MAAKEFFQRETFPSTFLETDGTSLKAGLDVVRKFGVALESEFPWDGFVTKDYEIFNRDVRRRRIMAYYNLGLDAHEWRHWLHAERPVAVLVKEDRHLQTHDRRPRRASTRTRSPAATPPRCSATARTTSCCARAGAPTGATPATRA